MEEGLEKYKATSERLAVCEFWEGLGTSLREVQPMVDLHDARASATAGSPLA